jgi:dienelactone hydrolase
MHLIHLGQVEVRLPLAVLKGGKKDMALMEDELYAQSRRQAFLERLGTLPQQCALDVLVEDHFVGEGYVREKISYMSSPRVRVPAYVLTPRNITEKAAAVVCIHQHKGEFHIGKSELVGLAGDPNMAFAVECSRRGYIAIVPDLEGFEERQATGEELERWKCTTPYMIGESAYEKFLAMRHLLDGSSLQARYVWDLSRAVDYLCTRSDVDSERIGAIGHSLGGQEVCWLMLFDRRVKVGACSCGIGTFATIFRDGINHNFAAYVPGMLQVGDMDQLIATLAPTPLFISAGSRDWFYPIDGLRQIAQVANDAYGRAGNASAYCFCEFPQGHIFPAEIRERAYRWLDRWLQG